MTRNGLTVNLFAIEAVIYYSGNVIIVFNLVA